jgi:hypothetical protein
MTRLPLLSSFTRAVSSARLPVRCGIAVRAAAILSIMWACGDRDARTEKLEPGIGRDSALAVLSDGSVIDSARIPPPGALVPASDTLKNIWRRAEYLVDGQKIEVLFYSPNDEKWKATDTIPDERVIPVVIIDGKVYGTGRNAYDDAVAKYRLPKTRY